MHVCVGYLVVGLLAPSEASAVDSVVEVLVNKSVDRVDLGEQSGRCEVVWALREVLHVVVDHADDVGGFVGDNRVGLLVKQDGDGYDARAANKGNSPLFSDSIAHSVPFV